MSQADWVKFVVDFVVWVVRRFVVGVSVDKEVYPLLCVPLGLWFITVDVILQLA